MGVRSRAGVSYKRAVIQAGGVDGPVWALSLGLWGKCGAEQKQRQKESQERKQS